MLLTALAPVAARAQTQTELSALIAVSDGHVRTLADTLSLQANTDAARSVQWARIRPLLAQIAPMNVHALLWFALPNGTYYSLQHGKESGNISTRAYFARLLAGHAVMGDLVVSKATKRASAIVAIPIVSHDAVVGALGASIYLDQLSTQVRDELQLPPNTIFFSMDGSGLVGINWDKSLIFLQPRTLSPEMDRAFGDMLAHTHGTITYTFRGQSRTVIYRKSTVTGWWYAIGTVSS